MRTVFTKFLKDENGATAIEYGLIAGLIAVALISGLGAVSNSLNNTFSFLSNSLTNAQK